MKREFWVAKAPEKEGYDRIFPYKIDAFVKNGVDWEIIHLQEVIDEEA